MLISANLNDRSNSISICSNIENTKMVTDYDLNSMYIWHITLCKVSFKFWSMSWHMWLIWRYTSKDQKSVSRFIFSQVNIWNSKVLQCCSVEATIPVRRLMMETQSTGALIFYIQGSSAHVKVRTAITLVNSNVMLINRNILNLNLLIKRGKKSFHIITLK